MQNPHASSWQPSETHPESVSPLLKTGIRQIQPPPFQVPFNQTAPTVDQLVTSFARQLSASHQPALQAPARDGSEQATPKKDSTTDELSERCAKAVRKRFSFTPSLRDLEQKEVSVVPYSRLRDGADSSKMRLYNAFTNLNFLPAGYRVANFYSLARKHVFNSFFVSEIPLTILGCPEHINRGLIVRELAGTFLRRYGAQLWPDQGTSAPWLVKRDLTFKVHGTCWKGSCRGHYLNDDGTPKIGEVFNKVKYEGYTPLIPGELASELLGREGITPPARGTLNDLSFSELGWRMREFFDALLQIPAQRREYDFVDADLQRVSGTDLRSQARG